MNLKLKHIKNWSELAQQANWSAAALAEKCSVSGDTLRRHFLKHLDKTPKVSLAVNDSINVYPRWN
jgi:transcriptional regulator GlxA family with amidase domain